MTDNTVGRRGRPPRTDMEWARDVQRRVESLEDSVSVRIGPWVLNVRNGDLIASTPGTTVVLASATATTVVGQSAMQGRGESTGTAGQ